MRQDTDISHQSTSSEPAPLEPAQAETYYNTDLLMDLSEHYIDKMRDADFATGLNPHKILKGFARHAKAVARQFLDMEFLNIATYLKDQMLRHMGWRRAVISALGGERALERWETRARKAQQGRDNPELWPNAGEAKEPEQVNQFARRDVRRRAKHPEDDLPIELGIFRLAKIKSGRNPNIMRQKHARPRLSAYRRDIVFYRIEVTPGELRRGRSDITDAEDTGYRAETGTEAGEPYGPHTKIDIQGWLDWAIRAYRTLLYTIRKVLKAALYAAPRYRAPP